MTKYSIFQQKLQIEGCETDSYGIAAIDENSCETARVSDITASYEKALRLCELCGRMNLSPCHLRDVAEDFIISDSY